ncbi:MAG TPA: FHA domain-containing protein [Stellaceae bacterium]|nr:FHA domain-containing protein [Stellaceae bacterium]
MDEIIWVEILTRHGDVAARYRCAGRGVRIGRAYSNDVVLDDPAVAPEHICILRGEDGRLFAEDLGSLNGLYLGHGRERQRRIALDGDRPIRIGGTYLRIRAADHAVAPDRIAKPQARRWPAALALAGAALGLALLPLWLGETGEFETSRYVLPILGGALLIFGWTAFWSVLARVFSRDAGFERNLLIALAGVSAILIYLQLVAVAAYAFSWPALGAYSYVGLWAMLAAVCFCHLRPIGPPRLGLKGAAVAGLLAVGIAAQAVLQLDTRTGFDPRDHVRRLLPPGLRLTAAKSTDEFFGELAPLKRDLDRARAKDTP